VALGVIVADRSGGHSWVCSRSMALMRGDFSSDTISADNDARVEWSAATAIEDPPAPSCASGTRMCRIYVVLPQRVYDLLNATRQECCHVLVT